MYLFLKTDGDIVEAYKDFDIKDPDWDKLRDVKEVWFVSKAYQPQMKLIPKPKDQRPAATAPAEPKGKGVKKGKNTKKGT